MSKKPDSLNRESERQRQAMQALSDLIPRTLASWDLGWIGYSITNKDYEVTMVVRVEHEDKRREWAIVSGESVEGAALRFLGMLRAGHVDWKEDGFHKATKKKG